MLGGCRRPHFLNRKLFLLSGCRCPHFLNRKLFLFGGCRRPYFLNRKLFLIGGCWRPHFLDRKLFGLGGCRRSHFLDKKEVVFSLVDVNVHTSLTGKKLFWLGGCRRSHFLTLSINHYNFKIRFIYNIINESLSYDNIFYWLFRTRYHFCITKRVRNTMRIQMQHQNEEA